MKSTEFCYWLQGFFELNDAAVESRASLTAAQVELIKQHLALVFIHEIDPSYPKEQQADLNDAHGNKNLNPKTGKWEDGPSHGVSTIGGVSPDGVVYRC